MAGVGGHHDVASFQEYPVPRMTVNLVQVVVPVGARPCASFLPPQKTDAGESLIVHILLLVNILPQQRSRSRSKFRAALRLPGGPRRARASLSLAGR
eukprot:2650545-Rhodomonas_salina.3